MTQKQFNVTEDRRGWHWDKGVPISTLITLLGLIGSIAIFVLNFDKRIEINSLIISDVKEDQEKLIRKTDKNHEDTLRELKEINRELKRMERN